MKNKCLKCGANADSEYCFKHKPKKQLQTKSLIKKSVISNKNKEFVQNNNQLSDMKQFFLYIWKKRPHESEVSSIYLGKEPMSTYFHHILPKNKYLESCFDEENIIILTLEEHSNVENDIYKYEEVNKRREQLILKYNL